MKVSIGLHRLAIESFEEMAAYAREAERLGVEAIWSAEAWAHDAITPLAYLAGKTERIKLGTGIIQVGTRTPALVAMTAMAMQRASHGRFLLGFGTSGPQVIEGWHGVSFKYSVSRMRELIEIVRMIMRGERAVYKGTLYELPLPGGEGKALRSGAPPEQVPIYLATLSPRSLEMTGEIADGWLGTSFMPEHADVMLAHIARGAEKAGRTLKDLDLQAGGAVAFGDDLEKLIAQRRPGIAFSLGAMGSREHNFYNAAYRRAGYEEEGMAIQRLWLEGRRDEAAAIVPDEMVLQSSLLGTEAMVKDRIRAYRDCGITTLRVDPAGSTTAARLETLGRFMRLVAEVNEETPVTA